MGFNQLARPYRWLERAVFGGRLQRARCAHMQTFLAAESILLLGEGDGRFLEALLAAVNCISTEEIFHNGVVSFLQFPIIKQS